MFKSLFIKVYQVQASKKDHAEIQWNRAALGQGGLKSIKSDKDMVDWQGTKEPKKVFKAILLQT